MGPQFTYIYRRWDKEADCCSQIIVITSPDELCGSERLEKLAEMTTFPPADFEEILQEADTVMVLDAHDRDIETMRPIDMDWDPVRVYQGWWQDAEILPVATY